MRNGACYSAGVLNLRFTSTLTREDENLMAEGLMRAMVGFLDLLPVAYSLRIDTSDSHVFEKTRVESRRTGETDSHPPKENGSHSRPKNGSQLPPGGDDPVS